MKISHVIRAEEHLPNTLRQASRGWRGGGGPSGRQAGGECVDARRGRGFRLWQQPVKKQKTKNSNRHVMSGPPLAPPTHPNHTSLPTRQVLIYQALGFPTPIFGHVSLILAPDKSKLSKRHGATSVGEFREDGYLAAVGGAAWERVCGDEHLCGDE